VLWTSTLVLYLHIISFMLTYAAVAAEYALLHGSPDPPTIRALSTADATPDRYKEEKNTFLS
jgi:putative membrane protein